MNFEEGGTASGSFKYDADLDSVTSVSIVTSDGAIRSGANYIVGIDGSHAVDYLFRFYTTTGSPALLPFLDLRFSNNLTNAGGIVAISSFSYQGTCPNNQLCSGAVSSNRSLHQVLLEDRSPNPPLSF